jgi:hypothetical protein
MLITGRGILTEILEVLGCAAIGWLIAGDAGALVGLGIGIGLAVLSGVVAAMRNPF